jgi:outer membrane protein
MRLFRAGLVAALLVSGAAVAQAQVEHPWLIRARGLAIIPNASTDPSSVDLDVESNAVAEVDINYSFSRLLSAELVLATSAHEVTSGGTSVGSVHILPPSLLVQVHPMSSGKFDPYVGAGGNLTIFYANTGLLEPLDLSTSFGWAVQGGFDYKLGERGVFNVDVKYMALSTDIESGGTKVATLDVDPILVGVGFGYRF